jgi:hypothetical protein
MVYILYEVRNKINNKIYVGIHKTDNLNDDYLGSGKLIGRAIKKYGKENFTKKILDIFDELEKARNKEKEIVNENFVDRNDTYNIAIGGGLGGKKLNGLTFENKKHSFESIEKIRIASTGRCTLTDKGRQSIIHSNKTNEVRKQKIREAFSGLPKTEEHKKKISQSLLQRPKSSIPRGYKRKYKQIWITDGNTNTKIRMDDSIPEGWRRGRV